MLLFVPVGLGAGVIVAICFVLMVSITVVGLFIYKKYHQRDTAVAQISKQPIVGDQTARRKRTKKPKSRITTTKFTKESKPYSLQADY